jgi:Histidine kinase-, DNA gyrase B-, and HSP90-like ATPase
VRTWRGYGRASMSADQGLDGGNAIDLAERNRRIAVAYRAGETMTAIAGRYGLSVERVRQLVRRAEGRQVGRKRRAAREGERVRLRIGNLAKAVLVTGQAYQDPKDALNEFVSNAADDYAEAGIVGGRIRVLLRRKGVRAVIAVDDAGRGMTPDRLREVARNLFESAKAGDDRTLGEKAIGLLAFQQLGGRCDVVSRATGSDETWTLRLRRGEATADLVREKRRARDIPGTTVFVSELDAEVGRVLTQRKVVEYLRRRRAAAIAAGAYQIEVVEGRSVELVTPDEPSGLPIAIPAHDTLWGKLEFALYVAGDVDRSRRVAVVGRAGTTIIDDLSELDEFAREPWTSGQLSGRVSFEPLRQTAGRRAILRDDDVFPVFRDTVCSVEPTLVRTLERVRRDVDAATAERMADALRQVFGRVLRELADLENPMRTLLGDEPGEGAIEGSEAVSASPGRDDSAPHETPSLDDLEPRPAATPPPPDTAASGPRADGGRHRKLPSIAPDPDPGHRRSRFDEEAGTVLYNDQHADYLLVKDDEAALFDYLATLVAKEYVVYNNARADSDELAEELVRMLIRVRRHLPVRTRRRS